MEAIAFLVRAMLTAHIREAAPPDARLRLHNLQPGHPCKSRPVTSQTDHKDSGGVASSEAPKLSPPQGSRCWELQGLLSL